MSTPNPRNPVRPARGDKQDLVNSIADLKEGELIWARDEGKLYAKNGGTLEVISAGLGAVSTSTPQDGDVLSYSGATAEWSPGGPVNGGAF